MHNVAFFDKLDPIHLNQSLKRVQLVIIDLDKLQILKVLAVNKKQELFSWAILGLWRQLSMKFENTFFEVQNHWQRKGFIYPFAIHLSLALPSDVLNPSTP